jgi:hypothetical protein
VFRNVSIELRLFHSPPHNSLLFQCCFKLCFANNGSLASDVSDQEFVWSNVAGSDDDQQANVQFGFSSSLNAGSVHSGDRSDLAILVQQDLAQSEPQLFRKRC